MRIFFPIGRFYPSQVGGPANTVYWHTCALNNLGISTTVITTSVGIKDGETKLDTLITTKCGNIYYGKGNELRIKSILKIISKINKADIVHLNSIFSIFSILSFFFVKIFTPKKKIIISPRGELSKSALQFSKIQKNIIISLYKLFAKYVTFHATSEKEKKEIELYFKNKIIVIPNLIQPADRINKSSNRKKQFIFIGRIHPIKAIHKLIDGLSNSKYFRKFRYKLIIAGVPTPRDKDYYNSLISLVKINELTDFVEFRGQVTGIAKEKLYAESKFLFLPSETENFGNVVIESLNQGTPVVASLNTPWEILSEYGCGYHSSNDPENLGKLIDQIINIDHNSYEIMSSKAKELVDTRFNVNYRIKEWVDNYYNILHRK